LQACALPGMMVLLWLVLLSEVESLLPPFTLALMELGSAASVLTVLTLGFFETVFLCFA
jgi:hypothetical protein